MGRKSSDKGAVFFPTPFDLRPQIAHPFAG